MASMRHPNIVAFMGVCITPPAIVTEHCERGSLISLLQVAKALPERAAELTWRYRVRMVRSLPILVWREEAVYLQFAPKLCCRCKHTLSSPMHHLLRCRSWALHEACCTCTTAPPPSSTATSRAPTSWWTSLGGSR
jgi:hypothetical protein